MRKTNKLLNNIVKRAENEEQIDISLPSNSIEDLGTMGSATANSLESAVPLSAAAIGRADSLPCAKQSLWGYRVTIRLSSV